MFAYQELISIFNVCKSSKRFDQMFVNLAKLQCPMFVNTVKIYKFIYKVCTKRNAQSSIFVNPVKAVISNLISNIGLSH